MRATRKCTNHATKAFVIATKELEPSLLDQTQQMSDAVSLLEFGAPTNLVTYLTGLRGRAVNQLHREIVGKQSHPGQAPNSDAWYIEDPRRMLHAAIIWGLYCRHPGDRPARQIIDLYEAYCYTVRKPLLSLLRCFFVPRLMAMNCWQEQSCHTCNTVFVAPPENGHAPCPGCTLYFRYRCRYCAAPVKVTPNGRRRKYCESCERAL